MTEPEKKEPYSKAVVELIQTCIMWVLLFGFIFGLPIWLASCSGPSPEDRNEWRVRELDNPGR